MGLYMTCWEICQLSIPTILYDVLIFKYNCYNSKVIIMYHDMQCTAYTFIWNNLSF